MADKSLSTIAKELWHGFGNNPANVETFNTLANVFPPAMLYRGAKTLSGADYPAIKDFLMQKYQLSDTPKQDIQRAAREHILTGPGQSTPGYAAGGLVASDYGDDHVGKLSDALMQGEYGLRQTGEPKTRGALGEVRMPDGESVMTEFSINPGGRGEMPSIVEGIHPADLNYLRAYAQNLRDNKPAGEFPTGVEAVAIRSAKRRQAEGKPAFYARGGLVYNDAEINNLADQLFGA